MACVRITLFDFDEKTQEAKEPITAEIQYDSDLSLEDQGYKKLAIFAGDDVAGGTLFVPLAALNALMTTVMMTANKRDNASGLILPKKPGIIKPH